MAKTNITTKIVTKRYNLYLLSFFYSLCTWYAGFSFVFSKSIGDKIVYVYFSILILSISIIVLGNQTGAAYKVKEIYVDGIKIKEEEVEE